MHFPRPLTAALAAGAVLAAAAAAPAGAGAATPPACPAGARCGTVTVPLDRATPALGTTTVGYALIPRRDQSRPAAGTIVPNPGGPGAATEPAKAMEKLFRPLRDDHDLLLIDPRGVGRSGRLTCTLPGNLADLGPLATQNAVGVCGRSLGQRAGAYGSATIADDFDDVRAALGIDRLDLVGESYGSFLFAVYARRHPERVSSLVLAGAYPIAFDTFGRDRAAALRRALRVVCARSRGACSGRRVLADLGTIARALKARPVTVSVEGRRLRIDEEALALTAYTAALGPELYSSLPKALRLATRGRAEPLLQLIVSVKQLYLGLYAEDGEVNLALNSATSCRDYPVAYDRSAPVAQRRAQYRAALKRAGRAAFAPFTPEAWIGAFGDGGDSCIAWPDVQLGDDATAGAVRPAVPTLAIDGELDTNTPSSAARAAAKQFAGARFVEVPNVAHTPMSDTTGCAQSIVNRFIRTHAVGDTRCLKRIPPLPVAR